MIPPLSATRAALLGMQASLRTFERAADTIARFGLESGTGPSQEEPVADAGPLSTTRDEDFLDAMVDVMVAQRAFSAQLRVLETANDMTKEAIDLGRHKG